MSETIEFQDMPNKAVDEPKNQKTAALRDKAIEKLEAKQIEKTVKTEAGINELPPKAEQIPEELPRYLFDLVGNKIQCDKFALTDKEAALMAKHISNLTGNINSKVFSAVIIIIVILSKVTTCMRALKNTFGKKQTPEEKQALQEQGRPSA